MSRMKDFAIEIENAGIDYRIVDLEAVEAYREAYSMTHPDGQGLTLIEAAKALYC